MTPIREGVCSIVIPVFNRESMISETVWSCLKQDYLGVEIIVVDDGSTDRSLSICQQIAVGTSVDGKEVRVVHQRNAGACAARNRGMDIATGEYLLFLDADDLIPPDKLSIQIAAMEKGNADCSISDFQTIDEVGRTISVYRNDLAPKEFIRFLRSPSNSAIVMRTKSLPSGLKWRTSLRRMQDFDFMLRYLSNVVVWAYVPEPLYDYRIHSGPRISDTYQEGMPYLEVFFSMAEHLRGTKVPISDQVGLLAPFGRRLLGAYLRDTASRTLPVTAKRWVKKAVR